jgi:hypothetical protein
MALNVIRDCAHIAGGELVCYWECDPDTGAQNHHVLICEICGGRFVLQIPKVEENMAEKESSSVSGNRGVRLVRVFDPVLSVLRWHSLSDGCPWPEHASDRMELSYEELMKIYESKADAFGMGKIDRALDAAAGRMP